MLKSWKTRALATAGAVALAAPFAFMGGASAVPGTPTVTSLSPSNGPSPSTVAVEGTGCGTTTTPATSVELFVTGPGITTPTAVQGQVLQAGVFTGTVTITGRAGEVFNVVARCTDSTGTGQASTGGPAFTVQGTGLTTGLLTTGGSSTGGLLSTTSGGVTGTGLTSTSGTTTAGATTGFSTTGSTTGGAVPIPRTPNFTG